ncbi:MAG: hypothetical protein LBT48_02320 [Prevotellaceae bacterium]|jgi:hypothetical protein|nr:hypothetical protein [Prevotellaceae bacterium]
MASGSVKNYIRRYRNAYLTYMSSYKGNLQSQSASAISGYNSNPQNQQSFTGAGSKAVVGAMLVLAGLGVSTSKVVAQNATKAGSELASNVAPAATKTVNEVAAEIKPRVVADTLMRFEDTNIPFLFRFINTLGGSKTFNKMEIEYLSRASNEKVVLPLEYFSKEVIDGKISYFFGFGNSAQGGKALFCFANESADAIVGAYKSKGLYCAVPKN